MCCNGGRQTRSCLAGGLINATRQIGGAVGLALLTFLGGYGQAFLACAVVVLLTGLLSAVTIRDPKGAVL